MQGLFVGDCSCVEPIPIESVENDLLKKLGVRGVGDEFFNHVFSFEAYHHLTEVKYEIFDQSNHLFFTYYSTFVMLLSRKSEKAKEK
jgi:hypothetical protein